MGKFDFVIDKDFRKRLENDYGELNICLKNKAWVASCVLAGSIIEAILIDFLVQTGEFEEKKILKKTFEKLIDICDKKKFLSVKPVQLSHAIRNYRNLIHPGKRQRLREEIGEEEANIAKSLLNIIIREIVKAREDSYGYTAEQILSRIEDDPSFYPIFQTLLEDIQIKELKNLLEIVPERYFQIKNEKNLPNEIKTSFENVFRSEFKKAPRDLKETITRKFYKMLTEEETGKIVLEYETIFFRATDLEYLEKKESKTIKEHLLWRFKNDLITEDFLNAMNGFGRYISIDEAKSFADKLAYRIVNINTSYPAYPEDMLHLAAAEAEANERLLKKLQHYTEIEYAHLNNQNVKNKFKKIIDSWIEYLKSKDNEFLAERLSTLFLDELPF